MTYRQTELNLKKKVYIDDETHRLLRLLKRKRKQSMARIVKELILKTYEESK